MLQGSADHHRKETFGVGQRPCQLVPGAKPQLVGGHELLAAGGEAVVDLGLHPVAQPAGVALDPSHQLAARTTAGDIQWSNALRWWTSDLGLDRS